MIMWSDTGAWMTSTWFMWWDGGTWVVDQNITARVSR